MKIQIRKITFLFTFLFLSIFAIYGQNPSYQLKLTQLTDIQAINDTDTLALSFSGGLNSPQFSSIDLNNDGIQDIFIFDRANYKCYTFVNNDTSTGSYHYEYAPQYEQYFPSMKSWCLLRDYNNDGKEDIFTYTPGGIRVFKNTTPTGQHLSFQLVDTLIQYFNVFLYPYPPPTPINLYIPSTSIPYIGDLDYDGDLDILSTGIYGNRVSFFRNMSVENYGNSDSLNYELRSGCWGHIIIGASTCPTIATFMFDTCADESLVKPPNTSSTHQKTNSSTALLALHVHGDSSFDLLVGKNQCNNLLYLQNDTLGYQFYTSMVYEDDSFPKNYNNTLPVNITDFPAAYSLDIDNDGIKDLIVAPNEESNGVAYNDYNSAWAYKNNGNNFSADYSLINKHFLQGNMIDVGTGASPALADINGDGLLDLIVANYSYYDSSGAQLAYYKNIGTAANPIFKLININWGNINSYVNLDSLNQPALGLSATFADINNDGVLDMLIGDSKGYIHWFTVDSTGITLMQIQYDNINVGKDAAPQLVDLNKDGLMDLVIGNALGNIFYYKNTGTATNPSFTLVTNHLGNVNTAPWWDYDGNCHPYFFKINNHFQLLCATRSGHLYYYTDIDSNLNGTFIKQDTTYEGIYSGYSATIAGGDFIGSDGIPDIIIGELTGGLTIFKGDTVPSTLSINNKLIDNHRIYIYPNPAKGILYIGKGDTDAMIKIYNATGQLVKTKQLTKGNNEIDIAHLNAGVYFIAVQSERQHIRIVKKFIKIK